MSGFGKLYYLRILGRLAIMEASTACSHEAKGYRGCRVIRAEGVLSRSLASNASIDRFPDSVRSDWAIALRSPACQRGRSRRLLA